MRYTKGGTIEFAQLAPVDFSLLAAPIPATLTPFLHEQETPFVRWTTNPLATERQTIVPVLDSVYGSCRYAIRFMPSEAGTVL
jgi:hypothetical protein